MTTTKPQLTGRTRHRVQSIGLFRKRYVLVLQYEVKGFVPEYTGGPYVDGSTQTWWVDCKPEWRLTQKP